MENPRNIAIEARKKLISQAKKSESKSVRIWKAEMTALEKLQGNASFDDVITAIRGAEVK